MRFYDLQLFLGCTLSGFIGIVAHFFVLKKRKASVMAVVSSDIHL